MRPLAKLCLCALCALLLTAPLPAVKGQTAPLSGIVCSTSGTATFTLTTTDGYISLPDGNQIYMWGFAQGGKPFQHPGPVLCVNQGDTVTIVLNNTLDEDVSIIFPGQENVLANGQPAQPQLDSSGKLTSLTNVAAKNGGSATYSFVAAEPGTYVYESGTSPERQVQMGLFGALVVRPAGHADWGYNRADTQFNPANEYVMLLSEIDPVLHTAIENGTAYDPQNYTPRYWLINGRSFPDTVAPNNAAWLPNQPYGALVHIRPYDASNPLPALVRYLSVGPQDYPFHPHGNHARVIARDGRVLAGSGGQDASFEKFTVVIGPGQTVDTTFTWSDAEQWDATSNPLPITLPRDQNLAYGEYFSGDPYLGTRGGLPTGTQTNNQCGEYYHVAHNHALQKITSWGITMSGMLTYTRIDPPLPNSCP